MNLHLLLSFGVFMCLTSPFWIKLIRFIQHFAPDSIRMKCRFEPSCSQDTISAPVKYAYFFHTH
ncbi:MAG: membrane protein insertion efficiency factor YidD [Lachnospiraceae bacterium]|nr:membrane protein insertion efficiency factor YidD [Lachnospiraceae bacterium]